MIGIDTNVLLRLLVDDADAAQQSVQASALLESTGHVYIAYVVFIETMWVLSRRYRLSRAQIADIGTRLIEHDAFTCEQGDILVEALAIYRDNNIGFGDALALISTAARGCSLHTFDRKLSRLEGARLVES